VSGETWSFDGINATTKSLLYETYNGSIQRHLGRAIPLTSRVVSFSSDDSVKEQQRQNGIV
jgi:hypothetical protein